MFDENAWMLLSKMEWVGVKCQMLGLRCHEWTPRRPQWSFRPWVE